MALSSMWPRLNAQCARENLALIGDKKSLFWALLGGINYMYLGS